MDKVKGLEGKLDYQIKKLIGLAEAHTMSGRDFVDKGDDVPIDALSFRPNPSAITASRRYGEPGEEPRVYRPPRVAAVPYVSSKARRTDRRAPALLSEFASTMDGAPMLESTSGLSTRPAQVGRHSSSAKRAAELDRINRFEEENMTRLVTTKREAKRRREDEEALALGYGMGSARSGRRKQNGLEAELEGVLGERGSKGLWEGVGGERPGLLEYGHTRGEQIEPVKRRKAR